MAPRVDDPITASVIQASLAAAAEEMFAVLQNTAMSPIIYEVLDVNRVIAAPFFAGSVLAAAGRARQSP